MYDKILNPITNQFVSIKSKEGKRYASKGTEKRRDVKKQKFPYSR